MTGSQKWLGHDDVCSIQWSDYCDCAGPHASSWTADLADLERGDPAVAAASESLDAVYDHLKGRLPADQVAHIYDLERPFEKTLSDGDGDLG